MTTEAAGPPPAEPQPLVTYDGAEYWLVYPEDNIYQFVQGLEADEKGIRQVKPELLENWAGGWSWRQAAEGAQKLVEGLQIPWTDLECSGPEVAVGDLMAYSEKLAKTSHYIVRVNALLAPLASRQVAAKEQLDHAVNLKMARQETYGMEGDFAAGETTKPARKPAQALRAAATISKDKRLRNMKIDLIETSAAIRALETTLAALDILWRTTSRIVSARLKEPID